MKLTWHEPKDATTPRGWCYVPLSAHPDYDRDQRHRNEYLAEKLACGNYLEYRETRGPSGESVHACAYLIRVGPGGTSSVGHASRWVADIPSARSWIEEMTRENLAIFGSRVLA